MVWLSSRYPVEHEGAVPCCSPGMPRWQQVGWGGWQDRVLVLSRPTQDWAGPPPFFLPLPANPTQVGIAVAVVYLRA